MGYDFDILEHCRKVRADHGPPYTCPIEKCGRPYKSVCGLQYHLKSYDHDNPTPLTPLPATPKNKKGKGRNRAVKVPQTPIAPEPLSFEEAQKMVQLDLNGVIVRININDPLEVIAKEESPEEEVPKIEPKLEEIKKDPVLTLPEAAYKQLTDYNICDAPPRPNAYIRFIEKSAEELDGEVEYDVDEEDTAWLAIMNKKRDETGLNPVSVDSLELLMDRFEKESYFQASVNGQTGAVVDDDAVCCICMDGECQNTNVILFCDMCNLAVHQDCYGVPYIPEGQWLCRRCLQSPSRAVDCVLCPNQGGAFKQTDRSQWAHVVCALWIPEVRFANTVFLEPIDSIEMIPAARWRLTCYVCKQKGIGACIQCHKNNCYSAFHVTCAQQAGLYMKMDTVKNTMSGKNALKGTTPATGTTPSSTTTTTPSTVTTLAHQPVLVQKIAYCDAHAPVDFDASHVGEREEGEEMEGVVVGGGGVGGVSKKEVGKEKMKQARKLLAKKKGSVPVILIPTIPPERIQEIGSLVNIQKKSQFIQRLIAYWMLKRQFRNGVPLLRRLQSVQGGIRDSGTSNVDTLELCRQLKYWQCLRQDLERARLLCELVRKREKMKVEYIKSTERSLNVQLRPLDSSLRKVLEHVALRDTNDIFSEPVDLEEVPDYSTVVTHPMDLSTMKYKLDKGCYKDLTAVEKDFDLMIANCLAYNNRDTVFYKAAVKMRDQCSVIFKQAKKDLEIAGLLPPTVADIKKPLIDVAGGSSGSVGTGEELMAGDIDKELELLQGKTGVDAILKLETLLIKSQQLKHGLARAKRVKLVRNELNKVKKILAASTDSSQSDMEVDDQSKNTSVGSNSTSPTGVNRRTAVLFTRKALATSQTTTTATTTPVTIASTTSATTAVATATTTVTVTPKKVSEDESKEKSEKEPEEVIADGDKKTPNKRNKKARSKRHHHHHHATELPSLITSPTVNKPPCDDNNTTKSPTTTAVGSIPDSFLTYRGATSHTNDDDDLHSDNSHSHLSDDDDDNDDDDNDSNSNSSLSTCYSHTLSELEEDSEGGVQVRTGGGGGGVVKKRRGRRGGMVMEEGDLAPLQLVWAKCRGYPWYPALIIDPEMSRGYVHYGVPIPSPPTDVLALSSNYTEHVYLILFFDAKRTWQWLPADKLEILGLDPERDEAKTNEPRKPTDRKAVKRAYENAWNYQKQISEAQEIETTTTTTSQKN